MALPVNHKTVFVFDNSPQFGRSCNQSIDYDILGKGKAPGIIPAAPIFKTMWTCTTEAIMEYIRIVYDIYPDNKLIKVVCGSQSLNAWSEREQNMHQIMQGVSHFTPGSTSDEFGIVHGLTQAVEDLCQPSDLQTEIKASTDADKVDNKGRIICVTSVKSEAQLRMLEGCVNDAIEQHNSLAQDTAQINQSTCLSLRFLYPQPLHWLDTYRMERCCMCFEEMLLLGAGLGFVPS